MKCRKCGEEAVILVPVRRFVMDYIETRMGKKTPMKVSFLEGLAMRLRRETPSIIPTGPVTLTHGHTEEHYEGRCEQCWKAERMTDGTP